MQIRSQITSRPSDGHEFLAENLVESSLTFECVADGPVTLIGCLALGLVMMVWHYGSELFSLLIYLLSAWLLACWQGCPDGV